MYSFEWLFDDYNSRFSDDTVHQEVQDSGCKVNNWKIKQRLSF